MPTSTKVYPISQGTPVTAAVGLTFIGTRSDGTRGAQRRLVHPNSSLPPITYFSNPDRQFNMDNDALIDAQVTAFRGLEDTTLVRFDSTLSDVIITEIWTAIAGSRYSMPTFFFRQLYEYFINEPDYDPVAQEYIQYQPRDRNDFTYNIEVMRLSVGGGAQNNQLYDVADVRQKGGLYDPDLAATIMNSTDDLNVLETGLLDRTVQFQFRLVSKVT